MSCCGSHQSSAPFRLRQVPVPQALFGGIYTNTKLWTGACGIVVPSLVGTVSSQRCDLQARERLCLSAKGLGLLASPPRWHLGSRRSSSWPNGSVMTSETSSACGCPVTGSHHFLYFPFLCHGHSSSQLSQKVNTLCLRSLRCVSGFSEKSGVSRPTPVLGQLGDSWPSMFA